MTGTEIPSSIFPQPFSGIVNGAGHPPPPQPPAPGPTSQPSQEPTLDLTSAELVSDPRFQRTMIGMGGQFASAMFALNRMPDRLAATTKLPRLLIDEVRCGLSMQVTVGALCILADALDCVIELRLLPRAPRPPVA